MSVIRGKDVILRVQYNGELKPIACARTCLLNTECDLGETSSKNTGAWKTFRGTKLSWDIAGSGLCSEDMNHTVPQLRQLQFSRQAVFITFTATDPNGIVENFSGFCIITHVGTEGTYNANYEYEFTAQGIGELIIDNEVSEPNECCDELWEYYTGVGGEYETSAFPTLVDVTISGRVYRDGLAYTPSGANHDGTATPVGKQFQYDSANGKIIFSTDLPPLEPGELVDIPYKTCEVPTGEECIPVTIDDIGDIPDALVDETMTISIPLLGTAPFNLVPGWQDTVPEGATLNIVGTNVVFVWTPTEASAGTEFSFKVSNCSGSTDSWNGTIIVIAPDIPIQGTLALVCNDEGCTVQGGTSMSIVFSEPTPADLTLYFGQIYLGSGDSQLYGTGQDIMGTIPPGVIPDTYYGSDYHKPFVVVVPFGTTSISIPDPIFLKDHDGEVLSYTWICHSCLSPLQDLYVKIATAGYSADFTLLNVGITLHNVT